MSKAKTHEDFLREMKEKHPNIKVLGTYKNNKTKVKCKCLIDNNIWETTPNKLLYANHGCHLCGGS